MNPITVEDLKKILQENGIVGAGGAGFPTYAKIDDRADTLILNCAECEPLLKLHRQLLEKNSLAILSALYMISKIVGAENIIIAVKEEYTETILSVKEHIGKFPNMRLEILNSVYPMGDEIILTYEVTGKIIPPGSLPIESGITIFNVETIYNIHQAVNCQQSVTRKLVSIVGEVSQPITTYIPLGCTIKDAVSMAGEITVDSSAVIVGGPMMGSVADLSEVITKTTNAILVLPRDHFLIRTKNRNPNTSLKRASSACCQCQACTDLCPRHLLGYPIEPHKFMRAACNKDFQNMNSFTDTLYCSSCGICEMFSCPQSLAPRSLLAVYKSELAKAGVRPEKKSAYVNEARNYRKVDEHRLKERLGLGIYDKNSPLTETDLTIQNVKIPLKQHIGTPATPIVSVGEKVVLGQTIGMYSKGLSVSVHASLSGIVTEVNHSISIRGCLVSLT